MLRKTALLTIVLSGCSVPDARPTLTDLPELRYEGYSTFPTPRTHDAPGTVFRVNDEGEKQLVVLLDVKAETGTEVFVKQRLSSNLTGDVLARLLGDTGFSSGLQSERRFVLEIELGQGHTERTYDADVDPLIPDKVAPLRQEGWDYYIIRETISVDSIAYKFINSSELEANVRADLDKLTQLPESNLGAKVGWSDEDERELVQTFAEPYRLFYKVARIEFDDASRPIVVAGIVQAPQITKEITTPPMVVSSLDLQVYVGGKSADQSFDIQVTDAEGNVVVRQDGLGDGQAVTGSVAFELTYEVPLTPFELPVGENRVAVYTHGLPINTASVTVLVGGRMVTVDLDPTLDGTMHGIIPLPDER